MPDVATDLVTRARALSPEERTRLAELLLESVQESPSAEVEAQWDAEIHRRVAEIESGRATLVHAEDVFARVRQALG